MLPQGPMCSFPGGTVGCAYASKGNLREGNLSESIVAGLPLLVVVL